ncbi:PEPxxWA-CTERM sorting domain-containing protein [Altererythrobacter aurantiacus]|uniref:PEPxxWA-CTERM sorting domain-containing protein n=1 Tax=Parapontixanthobacter aurantiacus TaxID=1463599 RepID=A0A844ZHE2_9SPHN|nr:PEPxxWA-CTERM sorting domain-containing protein [Parapontixanthobacter aurantiacus]MXO86390.1 PEPxxWA-CTERM sorting domain-containing protein [Parapontixanthobacter aurantiacus]
MNVLKFSSIAIAATAAAFATQASAGHIIGGCSVNDINPTAEACSGFYAGNILSNNATDITYQIEGLAAIGYTFDGNWSAVEGTKIQPLSGGIYDFASLLNGITYVGIHKGKGGQGGINGTAFYRLDADNLDSFKLNLNGGSSAVLYSTGTPAVPEPGTWALLMFGFAAVGFAMRRNRETSREVRVRYA